MAPSVNALTAFMNTEKDKLQEECPTETLNGYAQLFNFSLGIANTSITGSLRAMNNFYYTKLGEGISAWIGALKDDESLSNFAGRLEETLRVVVHEYPKAIEAIGPEFGFHLDNGGYVKVAETERFYLYQVLPTEKEVPPRHKPILIVPPYVLGPNILAFLPEEHRSYVHCYANLGIPTYIRLVKDIHTTPAVQTMTGEDDALDTRFFCRELMAKHNEQVTLNGFCQGGYLALTAFSPENWTASWMRYNLRHSRGREPEQIPDEYMTACRPGSKTPGTLTKSSRTETPWSMASFWPGFSS